jgi:hypothetical protein
MRKLHIFFFLCCVAELIPQSMGRCEHPKDLVETMTSGSINWTSGLLAASGLAVGGNEANKDSKQAELVKCAHQQAARNLLDVLTRLKINHQTVVADLMKNDADLTARLIKMTHHATLLDRQQLPDGGVQVTLQIGITGAFAQLILPVEIKQVEGIKPMNQVDSHPDFEPGRHDATPAPGVRTEVPSGLVVDARGIDARPAMVPLILDENGRELYGPAFISREYAVSQGACQYIRSLDEKIQLDRAGPHPLIIKGLRAKSKGSSDIVVSSADAARLRNISTHLEFLKQCRVIIVLD